MLKVLTANTHKEQVNNDNERPNSSSLAVSKNQPLSVDLLKTNLVIPISMIHFIYHSNSMTSHSEMSLALY